MAVNGIDLIIPSSIAHSPGSASINYGGSVTFTGVATLSLNGVFSSTYDNYIVDMRHLGSNTATSMDSRLRASGTDATGANYTEQFIFAGATTVSAGRNSSRTAARIGSASSNLRSGFECFIYGPNLAQPTAMRSVSAEADQGARILDLVSTHSLSTAHDGLTFIMTAGTFSGLVKVYGLVK